MGKTETESDDQAAVVRFLMSPGAYPHRPDKVERIDTHGAIIFLAGERAYKLKRDVKLAYLDFSSVEKRRAVCERELALNSVTAPEIYLGILPVRRTASGEFTLVREGEIVDWLIEMRRFDGSQLFDKLAEGGRLDRALVEKLAVVIEQFHAHAARACQSDWPETLRPVMKTVTDALHHDDLADLEMAPAIVGLEDALGAQWDFLAARRKAGLVRRCHGDLHLKNIVLYDGEPRLFDALEFDEQLATIDVFYDLAFLLMDMWHRALRAEANAMLNHYCARDMDETEWAGLSLLPLFMALRAGVRAMVGLDEIAVSEGAARERHLRQLRDYALLAKSLIAPPPPRLVAVGGVSGTGKTTVARGLAPRIGAAPGAVHLRSDVERKQLFGAAPTQRLGAECYSDAANHQVYDRLIARAEVVLRTGHSVILDSTFLHETERDRLSALSDRSGVALDGVWLDADEDQLARRVSTRAGDASDADVSVVRQQLSKQVEAPTGWRIVDARSGAAQTIASAAVQLDLPAE